MPWAPSHGRCAQCTFCTPIRTKALEGVQPSHLVTGHTQDTVTAPSPSHSSVPRHPLGQPGAWPSHISDLEVRHWLYPPHCVPGGGEHTPWATRKASPLFSVEDSGKEQLSGTHLNIHNGQAAQAFQEYISRHLQTVPE